jgi:hypothetical protein
MRSVVVLLGVIAATCVVVPGTQTRICELPGMENPPVVASTVDEPNATKHSCALTLASRIVVPAPVQATFPVDVVTDSEKLPPGVKG